MNILPSASAEFAASLLNRPTIINSLPTVYLIVIVYSWKDIKNCSDFVFFSCPDQSANKICKLFLSGSVSDERALLNRSRFITSRNSPLPIDSASVFIVVEVVDLLITARPL